MKNLFWQLYFIVPRRVRCWFVGHNERLEYYPAGYSFLADCYCDRCFVNEPADYSSLPNIMNRMYIWTVEQRWNWFDKLDGWLCKNHSKRLPDWWSY